MKIKIEGCLSFFIILAMVAFGLFLTYLFALGVVTFVDKVGHKKTTEKVIIVDTTGLSSKLYEDIWDKAEPLTDDAI